MTKFVENISDMSRSIRNSVLFISFILYFSNASAQGYDIKVKIPELKDSMIILGHHFAESLYPDDTIKLDKNGSGVFKGKKTFPGGMYFIFLPNKKFFDFLLDKDQAFSIETDTADFLKYTKFTGSTDNQLFYEYQNLINSKREEANKLFEQKKNAKTDAEKKAATEEIDKINKEVLSYIKNTIENNKGLFISTFLKALQDIDVPDAPRDAKGNVTDSLFQYNYYKTHYFDNLDYRDARLLRTPIYQQKIKNYIEKVIPQMPDSINAEVDKLLENTKSDTVVFRYMLVTLFNEYGSSQIMGQDAVFVHIANKWYLPYATWSDKEFKDKLVKEVAKKEPNLIGNIAPDLKLVELPAEQFVLSQTDTALKSNPYVGNPINLHDIKTKFLVVAFWEADCGHCKVAIPKLHDIYEKIKDKGVEVLAIHMIASVEGKRKWIDFVNEHQLLDWRNAWSPYSYDYKDLYDVYSTPVIYVLDENKKIIAKRISPEQVEDVINFELEKKKK